MAIRHCGRIIINLIPKIIDTPRIIRILGIDEKENEVVVNSEIDPRTQEALKKVFDLTVGKYDVVVSIGPSFDIQREETAEVIISIMEKFPESAPILADLFVKSLAFPFSEEIYERLKKLVPPNVLSKKEMEERMAEEQEKQSIMPQESQQPDPVEILAKATEEEKVYGLHLDNFIKLVDIVKKLREAGNIEQAEKFESAIKNEISNLREKPAIGA